MKKYLSIIVSLMLIVSPVYALDSGGVIYDNSTSGSSATNVNDALNDLYSKLDTIKNIGNATSDKILSGYTAYVKGNTITGSIPSKGAATYTPGTVNQTIASGQYLSGVQTIKGDANLVAANIAKGKTIFGVSGTYTSDATATAADIKSGKTAYVNGIKITGSSNSLSLGDTITSSLASKKTTAELVVPSGVTKGFLIVNAITTMRKTVSSEISGSGVVTQKSTDAGTISRGDQNAYVNTKIYEVELAPGGTVTANVLNYYSSTYVGVSIILLA